jgi:hypothetical protein
MFSSKPPVRRWIECRGCIDSNGGRDWYDEFQHNEPNPILISFRANDQNPDPAQWVEWLRLPSLDPWHYARRDHIDHARRVLTRLARLQTEVTL